jgi:hypothetical protein
LGGWDAGHGNPFQMDWIVHQNDTNLLGGHQSGGNRLACSVEICSRNSLKQVRQVHLYSGTPGRTVWAQSRQTNRPSLWAIIGVKSIPAMQCEQRTIKIVSVRVDIWLSCTEQRWLARGIPDELYCNPAENQQFVGQPQRKSH